MVYVPKVFYEQKTAVITFMYTVYSWSKQLKSNHCAITNELFCTLVSIRYSVTAQSCVT